jgi:uncharacterized membrane protein required for colicin V production
MLLDIALLIIGVVAISMGYNRGALATIFSIIGYLGGGVAGFALANWYSADWQGLVSIIGLHLFAIFAGANLGRWLLNKTGIGIHKRILFGPFKFVNAVLGAALSLAQAVIIAFVALTLINYLPWQLPQSIIEDSRVYQEIGEVNLLSFQIADLLKSTSLRLDQLRS